MVTAFDTPLIWQEAGLSIIYADPITQSGRRQFIGNLAPAIESYSHEIRSIGGFYSASISFKTDLLSLEDWLDNGLGRHIQVVDEAQDVIWEGFVDRLTISAGGVQYSLGPVISSDIANRVRIRYSIADYTISPPSVGVTVTSAYANDTISQLRYGILEKTLSVNEVTETIARQIRDTWLQAHSQPPTSMRISQSGTSEPTVTLECLGYYHYLQTWTYNNSATGTITITEKIEDILISSPNEGLISSELGYVASNGTEVRNDETGDKTPQSIIEDLVSYGDSSNNQYTVGIYEGRKLYYQPIPEEITYIYNLFDNKGIITARETPINPWAVRPGVWIYSPGFTPGRRRPSTLDELNRSPHATLISSASFSTPFNVDVDGGKSRKLDRLFARMGLGNL